MGIKTVTVGKALSTVGMIIMKVLTNNEMVLHEVLRPSAVRFQSLGS